MKKLKFTTPDEPRVQYNDALHRYTIDGKAVPSVSQVCYNNADDYLFAKRSHMNLAAQFGTIVHDMAHEVNTGVKHKHVTDDEHLAHVNQFKAILKTHKLKVVGSEILLYSLTRKVCGRCDGIVEDAKGKFWIYDIKTGQLDPRAALQVDGGYRFMAEELFGIKIEGGLIFKLTGKDSVPVPIKYADPMNKNVFLCKLTSLQWDLANFAGK